jgi:hypothetical protein
MRQRSKTIGEAKDDSLLVSEERIVKRLHGEDGSGSPNSKRVTLSISPLAATEASAFDANSLVVAGGRSNGQFISTCRQLVWLCVASRWQLD